MSRIQEKKTITTETSSFIVIGIDVSKDQLDVFVSPAGNHHSFKNDAGGVAELVNVCRDHGADLVVLEATGRYHRMAHETLHGAGVRTAVANPARSRNFARSVGRLAKTDRIRQLPRKTQDRRRTQTSERRHVYGCRRRDPLEQRHGRVCPGSAPVGLIRGFA